MLDRIDALVPGREHRTSEIVAGLVIVAVALAFHGILLVTGTILVLVGALGMLHGLLMPLRWLEVRAAGLDAERPLRIHGLWRKTGRRLVGASRAGMLAAERARATEGPGPAVSDDLATAAEDEPGLKA